MEIEEGKQDDVEAYEKGRKGESDGSFISEPSKANVEGQKAKADADETRKENEKSDED